MNTDPFERHIERRARAERLIEAAEQRISAPKRARVEEILSRMPARNYKSVLDRFRKVLAEKLGPELLTWLPPSHLFDQSEVVRERERLVMSCANGMCLDVEIAKLELVEHDVGYSRAVIIEGTRKPLAAVITASAADAYETLTGKPVTRISKMVKGKGGLQEAGEFAKVLDELFGVFDVNASGAAQVKLWQSRQIP